MTPAKTRLRLYSGRLLLLAAPLVLTFVVMEVVLRVGDAHDPATPAPANGGTRWLTGEKSSELGWIFPPDTTGIYRSSGRHTVVTTNTWGLRGPAVSTDTLTDRVLVLGDSYAFGWGVADEDGFVRRLETDLRRKFPDAPLEVINGGLPGFSIYQQVRMLMYVRRRTRIAAVVATISLANDLVDELRIRRFAPDHLAEYSYELREPDSMLSRLVGASRALTWVIVPRKTEILPDDSHWDAAGHLPVAEELLPFLLASWVPESSRPCVDQER